MQIQLALCCRGEKALLDRREIRGPDAGVLQGICNKIGNDVVYNPGGNDVGAAQDGGYKAALVALGSSSSSVPFEKKQLAKAVPDPEDSTELLQE